jgi:hypothetical protein
VAFLWLPLDATDIDYHVLAIERRVLAVSTRHRLAKARSVRFSDVLDEPFVALPTSAGSLRDFWLAVEERKGRAPRIAAEVTNADETFEIVASGAAVHLLAEGNASIYARPGVTCVPVEGLGPAKLVIGWRRGERRKPVKVFVDACASAPRSLSAAKRLVEFKTSGRRGSARRDAGRGAGPPTSTWRPRAQTGRTARRAADLARDRRGAWAVPEPTLAPGPAKPQTAGSQTRGT